MNLPSHYKKESALQFEISIDDLSTDGRGVGKIEGKIYFVGNALPGETVKAILLKKRRQYNEAEAIEIIKPSPDRVEPGCAVYGLCGGCVLQHLDPQKQIHYKLDWLLDCLKKFVAVQPEQVLTPISGPVWNYRSKARLGVRFVFRKNKALVGFREKNGRYLTDMSQCEILAQPFDKKIEALANLISEMEGRERIPQIEVALAENKAAIVIRHLDSLSESDFEKLRTFENEHQITVYLQPKGPDTVVALTMEKQSPLHYHHTAFDLKLEFEPTDFTQINSVINEKIVTTAINWLDIKAQDTLLDLFCGIGNFSLPCSRHAKFVVGIEGSEKMVAKAGQNAKLNDLNNLNFYAANLQQENIEAMWIRQSYEKILIDPPRSGAIDVIKQLNLSDTQKLVYVSCHPASLARDAGVLVNDLGFNLKQVTVLDMFPHTAHVESIALFEK